MNKAIKVFTVNQVPVYAKPIMLPLLTGAWMGLSWLSGHNHPQRTVPERLLAGGFSLCAMLLADVGHAAAHTISAQAAKAPVDEILVAPPMPRTIYYDNNVSPRAHRLRAIGGPIYNAIGLASSLLLRRFARPGTIAHEVGGWSALAHAFIGSAGLVPFAPVDGGSILKWTLVERGRSPEEADAIVNQTSWLTAIVGVLAAIPLAARFLRRRSG